MTPRAGPAAASGRARVAWRGALPGLLLALAVLSAVPTSEAAFTTTSTRSPNTFVADTLNPPTGLTASRSCLSPTYRSADANGSSTTTSAAVTKPAGLVAGDVMVAWGVTGGTSAIVAEAGWTQLQELQTGNGALRASVFWKRAGSSEPASYTFSWSVSGLVGIAAYSGVDSVTAVDGSGISGSNVQGTSASTPVLTTSVAQTRLLHNLWIQNVNSISGPGLKVRLAFSTSEGAFYMLDEARPTAGTATTRTFSWSTAQYSSTSAVALRPASGNASSITLRWTATSDTYATGYSLTRDGGAAASIAGRTTTSRTETDVVDTSSYSYSLRSVFSSWTSTAATVTSGTC